MILKDYHRIEKGLALAEPRPGFGQDVMKRLIHNTGFFLDNFGESEATSSALSAIREYINFNNDNNVASIEAESFLDSIAATPACPGGTIQITRDELFQALDGNTFKAFVESRYSCRNFTGESVPDDLIVKAVEISRKTPSVCNRQTTKVYILKSPDKKKAALSLQNGNRGFGHQASHIAVITSNIRHFEGASERNQPYFDAGLFAMTFCLSLHALKVATCFLNWSADAAQDIKLHKAIGIPENEVIGTLIAIGTPPELSKYARSNRNKIEDFYEIL
jgi:nitroreductase|tara:strand:- start:5767 stop:6597 length:831 start_codon:yes stop_codon:yes gene_type:complete